MTKIFKRLGIIVMVICVPTLCVWASGKVGSGDNKFVQDPQFEDQNGNIIRPRTNDAGEIMVRLDAAEIAVLPDGGVIPIGPQEITGVAGGPVNISVVGAVTRLSASGGGDTLAITAPSGPSAGYALLPGYLVMRIQVKDPATLSRTITQWVYDSNDTVWKPGGVLVTTPGVEEAFDLPMGVGDGRLYLQGDNPYGDGGALIKVNVTVQSVP